MMAKLTKFGRKLPKAEQELALAVADIGERLKRAAKELYPGVDWKFWTSEMWDKIYEKAEKEWADEQRKTVGG